jgi:hypothetical protein
VVVLLERVLSDLFFAPRLRLASAFFIRNLDSCPSTWHEGARMIRLQPQLFARLEQPNGLRDVLQTALELELATIPPYLTAAYSLTGTTNAKIAGLIRDIAREEMLHMVLVGNLLNAVGGAPRLNDASVVPNYPSHLPGAIEDDLLVPLAPFSLDLVKNVFMRIEEPEKELVIPVLEADVPAVAPPRTIGQFYARLKQVITKGGADLFKDGDPARQVETSVDGDEALVVTDVDSALRAIDVIVGQGEGTSTSPFESDQLQPAHFYRFKEIAVGRLLRKNPDVPEHFSFGPDPIAFDPAGVFPMRPNLKAGDLPVDSPARALADDFNRQFTTILQLLHAGFNGQPARVGDAVNLMPPLKTHAIQLLKVEIATGVHAGPTFEFVATT